MGVEWNAAYQTDLLKLESVGNVSHSIISSNFKAYDKNRVPGFHPVNLQQRATINTREQLTLSAVYQFETGLFYDRSNSTLAPTKHLVNAEAKWQFEQSSLTFKVDNVLNRQHLDFSRKPLPRRTYTVTYQLNFGD